MTAVTLRIHDFDFQSNRYPRELLEDGVMRASDPLSAAALTVGPWTASNIDPPPDNDIVARVVEPPVQPNARRHADFLAIGHTLYDWLLPGGDIRREWDRIRAGGAPLALRLEIGSPLLARLPWELACSPAPEHRRIAADLLFRYAAGPATPAPPFRWPMRILLVVACDEQEEAALGIADEVQRIDERLLPLGRSVDLHTMYRPTRKQFMDWIGEHRPEVLHFAGHGSEYPSAGLLFRPSNGPAWVWESDDIIGDLDTYSWRPRFVFLNSCRSGVDQAATLSVQRKFLERAGAVLAMQADVKGDLAGLFARELYEACVGGATIAIATDVARRELRNVGGWAQIDWALPSLVTRDPDMKLFQPRQPVTDDLFNKCTEFEEARYFANCRDQRRAFVSWIYPPRPDQASKNVLLLTGEPRCGKSHLLKWCMETWALGGARVRFIEIELDSKPKNFLSVLRQIRDGELSSYQNDDKRKYLHDALPKRAFERFNWELNNILTNGVAGEWNPAERAAEGTIDSGLPPKPPPGQSPIEPMICESFLNALELVDPGRTIVLVFDKFLADDGGRYLPGDQFQRLIRPLFIRIAENPQSRIKLVFSVTTREKSDYGLAALPLDVVQTIDLPADYKDEELIRYAVEMFWYQDADGIRDIARGLFKRNKKPRGLVPLSAVRAALAGIEDPVLQKVQRMR